MQRKCSMGDFSLLYKSSKVCYDSSEEKEERGVRYMAGYLDSRKLTNVKGRIKYITNKDKQENIVNYFNTADNEFWKMLAKENQERHRQVKAGGKCCEARELIIGIPQNATITAEQMCNTFKNKYGVECSCAIHQNNKEGIINKHCHLIFSERVKLDVPEIVAEKRAARTYYYDEKGNKCKNCLLYTSDAADEL